MARLRVVLDTNVLLSGIAYPASVPGKIVGAWRYHGALEVVLSTYILDELARVLPKLKHRHGLRAAEIRDLIDILSVQAELVDPVASTEPDLRDANDQPVLATLLTAINTTGADYLVTGDNDLLALAARYPILTPARFWALHAGF
ncbi:MAG TPA: putative toxin-antitoxin system toxin component, PIN family [Candidatus Acidoferrum sp.]|nr:putative toxin-antitoxin system toxin component, PIN family [Candidatus Acidoferrum sp.]